MDKHQYASKGQIMLEDRKTYQEIKFEPTNEYKKRLINLLKKIKAEGGFNDTLYKKMYPTEASAPKFHGLPKIHKKDIPLWPVVSSRGTTTYKAAKELAMILRPLVGKPPQDGFCWSNRWHAALTQRICLLKGCLSTIYISANKPWHQHYKKESWIKIRNSKSEHPWHRAYHTLLELCLKPHTSSFKVSFLNSYKKQPWGHPLAL